MDTKCREHNRAGGPCGAQHYKDGWCRWHHPNLDAQRQAERAAGGAARSNKARAKKQLSEQVMSIADLDAVLCTSLAKVATGRMEPNIGSAVATLARTITTIRTASDLEKRLEALEQQAGVGTIRRFS
jgi:hypothetical protein